MLEKSIERGGFEKEERSASFLGGKKDPDEGWNHGRLIKRPNTRAVSVKKKKRNKPSDN